MINYKTLIIMGLGIVVCGGGIARADDFRFVRPGDPDRIFRQDESLVIELPANLQGDEMRSLFIELDGIDVTQVIALEGARAVFYPSSPYGAGSHALRLVRMGRNGKLVEINRWNFTVAGGVPPVEQPASVSGTVDATYNEMIWNDYDSGRAPDRHNLAAQGQVKAATQAEGWQLDLRANGFANSQDSYTPGGEHAEIGEYLVSAEKPSEDVSMLFRLGSHDTGASNLLMNNFYRRGASADFDLHQGRATLTGFAQNPAASIGNSNFTGFGEGGQRAIGVHATLRPLGSLDERLEIEGTAYQGKGSLLRTGTAAAGVENPANRGDGVQLGLRSVILPDFLTLRTQYARADFDYDGAAASPPERDEAYRTAFTITPLGNGLTADGRLRRWTVEASYQRVGTFYQTLTNPLLDGDRETVALNSSYMLGGLTLDGEIAWVTNNVDSLPTLPVDGALNAWFQSSYAPAAELFGHPVFSLGGSISNEDRRKTPVGFTGTGLDRRTSSVNAGVSMSKDDTTWSLTHTYTELDDQATPINGYHSHFTDLTVEFKPTDRITLRPGVQTEFLTEKVDGMSKGLHLSLGADVILVPDKLWSTTNASMLVNRGDTPAGDEYAFESEITWLLKPAETNKPGYAVALAGMYNNSKNTAITTDREDEDGRIFIRLKLSAPFAH